MKTYVAYVTSDHYGSKILGVSTDPEKCKVYCQSHYNDKNHDGETKVQLAWVDFDGLDGRGWQSIFPAETFYVEESELELNTREGESDGVSWEMRQLLTQMVANGRLAQQVLQLTTQIAELRRKLEAKSGV